MKNSTGKMLALLFGFTCFTIECISASERVPEHHTYDGFKNHPYVETAAPKGGLFYLRRFWNSVFVPDIPPGHALSTEESFKLFNDHKNPSITWLGHATFLIRISGLTILTDPFLTEFASPLSWAGPRRFVAPGIHIGQLPQIDIILVSHNHYDHLDARTVEHLPNKENIQVIAPLGLIPIFNELGYDSVTELDWGESTNVDGLKITSHSAVHDSGRSTDDHNRTLWSSWLVESQGKRIFFIGDTGYSDVIYRNIGEKYGSLNYAILPIGAYEPRELMWMSHVTPEEAVTIGMELRAKTLIASHWGTVSSLSDEPMWEPPIRFVNDGLRKGYTRDSLWVMKVGETRALTSRD